MKNKKPKFKNLWTNQRELGDQFGLSAVAVGKILIQHGLKDADTKLATTKAVDEGLAISTPLKDGTPHFMWNKEKIRSILAEHHQPLSKVDYWVREVKKTIEQADQLLKEGQDKIGYMLYDDRYSEVPKNIRAEVRKIIEPDDADVQN